MSPVCEVWDLDDSCCDWPDPVDYSVIERWQAVSSQVLWVASGRRYGLCEVTVRPCLRHCGGGSLPTPYKDAQGGWRNFATCGCIGDCSCVELCEVVLDGPVDSIVQVLIDGEEVTADSYRLDRVGSGWRLLRTDGGCWPSCSDITKDCDEVGAFCVTYLRGLPLDDLAIAANSELTCQLVRACLNLPCILPKNVTSVVRRGVAIQFDPAALSWLKALPLVGLFLGSANPNGLSSASSVWSPDINETRITVVAEGS